MKAAANRSEALRRWEWRICLVATLAGVWLHWVCLNHAGGLWRDEVVSVAEAQAPSFAEMWRLMAVDSFPLYFPLALRAWSGLGLGDTDLALRLHGFLVGMGLLGALWLNARALGRKLPLLSLGLLTINVAMVQWGDSLRPYGSSCVLMLVALALVWRLVEKPGLGRFVLAGASAVLSVQAAFQNAFLLLAAAGAGVLVCSRRRDWKTAALALAAGVPAALSLLPYVPMVMGSQGWRLLRKSGFVPGWVWANIAHALGSPYLCLQGVWLLLIGLSLGAGLRALRTRQEPESELKLFASAALALGVSFFMLFIWSTGVPTHIWYYVPLVSFVAACINGALMVGAPGSPPVSTSLRTAKEDACSASSAETSRAGAELGVLAQASGKMVRVQSKSAGVVTRMFRAFWLGSVSLLLLVSLPKANALAHCRQTNLDLLARQLEQLAKPGDLIVIFPWYCGTTFRRYYHGPTPWTSVPPMSDYRVQRFDLFLEQTLAERPMAPVLTNCEAVLAGGHRVWLVGRFELTRARDADAHSALEGWNEVRYERTWALQVADVVAARAGELLLVTNCAPGTISEYEDPPLYLAEGWRTNSPPETQAGSRADPEAALSHCRRAELEFAKGRVAEAVAQLEAALRLDPDSIGALNNLAWVRAACPQAQFRDGAAAVRLAKHACELTSYGQPIVVGTLAASYAEAGRFEEAAAAAEKARELALAAGQKALAKKDEELMLLFKARQRYRDKP